jgi:hypothetical protein
METRIESKTNVKRRYIINGTEYESVEDMPDNIRRVYEEALHSLAEPRRTGRITFNGKEYQSVEDMPPDIRRTYQSIAEIAESAERSPDPKAGAREETGIREKPRFEPLAFGRPLLLALLGCILLLVFHALRHRGH